jgi:hypothetical protein
LDIYWNILTMHGPINVKSPNNISEWQMGFNSVFKGLTAVASCKEWSSSQKADPAHHTSLSDGRQCSDMPLLWITTGCSKNENVLKLKDVWRCTQNIFFFKLLLLFYFIQPIVNSSQWNRVTHRLSFTTHIFIRDI